MSEKQADSNWFAVVALVVIAFTIGAALGNQAIKYAAARSSDLVYINSNSRQLPDGTENLHPVLDNDASEVYATHVTKINAPIDPNACGCPSCCSARLM